MSNKKIAEAMMEAEAETAKKGDLRLKIGSKEEVFWTSIKDTIKKQIYDSQAQIAMNAHMLPFIKEKIAEEQRKRANL